MYTEHSKRRFSDLYKVDQVYKCSDDIYCRHGIFHKGSLVFIEPVKLDAYNNIEITKHEKRPTIEYIKIFDYNEYLDVDIKKEDTIQDIPKGITTVNFDTAFILDEDQTDIITDACNRYDTGNTVSKVFNKFGSILGVVSVVVSFLTILAFFAYNILLKAVFRNTNITFIKKYIILAAIISVIFIAATVVFKVIAKLIYSSAKKKYKNRVYIETYDEDFEDDEYEDDEYEADGYDDAEKYIRENGGTLDDPPEFSNKTKLSEEVSTT